jgi:hypothetical protein
MLMPPKAHVRRAQQGRMGFHLEEHLIQVAFYVQWASMVHLLAWAVLLRALVAVTATIKGALGKRHAHHVVLEHLRVAVQPLSALYALQGKCRPRAQGHVRLFVSQGTLP